MISLRSRLFIVALGAWLLVSAFIWPHGGPQFTNAWTMGVLLVAFGALSIRVEGARYACAVVAIWVLFSTWILPTELDVTAWNNILVSLAVIISTIGHTEPSTSRPITAST